MVKLQETSKCDTRDSTQSLQPIQTPSLTRGRSASTDCCPSTHTIVSTGSRPDQQVNTPPALPASTYLFTNTAKTFRERGYTGLPLGQFLPSEANMFLVLWGSLFFNGVAYNF